MGSLNFNKSSKSHKLLEIKKLIRIYFVLVFTTAGQDLRFALKTGCDENLGKGCDVFSLF